MRDDQNWQQSPPDSRTINTGGCRSWRIRLAEALVRSEAIRQARRPGSFPVLVTVSTLIERQPLGGNDE